MRTAGIKKSISKPPGMRKPIDENNKYIYSDEIEIVRRRLDKFIKEYKISPQTIAGSISMGRSTVCMFLRRQYKIPELNLARKLKEFLDRQEEKLREVGDTKVKLPSGAKLIELAAMARIFQVLRYCREYRELGVIYGPPGVGKTTGLETFIKEEGNNDSHLITVNPFITGKGIILEVSETLGMRTTKSTSSMNKSFKQVVNHIKKNPAFLIFDEADLFNIAALKTLKALYDECNRGFTNGGKGNVGIVLCGLPQIFENMTKGGPAGNSDLAQLYGRVIITTCLPKPSREEIEEIIKFYIKNPSEEVVDALHKEASIHGLRRVIKLLPSAIEIAKKNKIELSAKIIYATRDAFMMVA